MIDPRTAQKVQPELMPGESIHWAGMPNPRVIFHSDDWISIPFSLVWTGFFVFWEADALGWLNSAKGVNTFEVWWGVPFLILGNYIVWVRFIVDAWLKRRTYYAVTDRRVLIVQDGWKKKTSSTFLKMIPSIEREGLTSGTLWFGPKYPIIGGRRTKKRSMSRFSIGDVPLFADIDDLESVCRLVMDLSGKSDVMSHRPALTY